MPDLELPSSQASPEQTLETVLARVAEAPARLAEILDDRSEPLIAFAADRTILAANAAAESFFGYGRRELDARPTDDIIPQRFRQPDAPPQLATEDLTTVELPGLRRDDSEIATVWTFGAVPAPGGAIFVLLVRDRARLTTQLEGFRRNDARYRSLILASATIAWVTNAEGDFVERQPAWEEYTGQTWEEYGGSKWISAVHPDDRLQVMADWTAAVRSRSELYRTQGRLWSARHNGWRAFQTRAVPVRDATSDEIAEWVGALTDVQDTVDMLDRSARRERDLEERFKAVYENALDGILLMDDAFSVVEVNPAACRLLGRTREQLIGLQGRELTSPAQRAQTPSRMGEFRTAGEMTGEAEMLLPDGSVRRAEFGSVANVSPGVHLTTFRDIEDRKRAEEAQRFLDEASRVLAASLDPDETISCVVRLAASQIADWVAVDLVQEDGSFRRVALSHADAAKVELAKELRKSRHPSIEDPAGMGAVVRTGKTELIELITPERLSAAVGGEPELLSIYERLGLLSAMTVPLSARGEVIGAISLVSAESRRRYGPADVAVAEELLRRASYALTNALFVRDLRAANERKDLFLRRAQHLQATAAQLVQAKSVADIARIFEAGDQAFPLDAHACSLFLRVGDRLELVAATQEIRETALRWAPHLLSAETPISEAARSGASVWLEGFEELVARFPHVEQGSLGAQVQGRSAIPIGHGDDCIGVVGLTFSTRRAFDAEERAYLTAVANLWGHALQRARLAEAEREAIGRALAAETLAARKKDEFMAMLGHELRNPLAPIVTATSLIRLRGNATDRELDILDRQSRHLVRLVDDLLDISRITSGKLSLHRVPIEIADVLAQAIESTAPTFSQSDVQFGSELAPAVMIVNGDRERLVQVVTNILVNAAKFTPAGRSVFLSADVHEGNVRIVVRDEGQGIDPELLPHVFELFTQAEQGTDRKRGGLGLGLAIAQSIVAAHDGRIEAASSGAQQGTSVTISLPLMASTQAGTSVEKQGIGTTATLVKHRVLIVDDSHDSRDMLASFLGDIGYEPHVASDGRRALAIAREVTLDAAILDIGLPEMDGYELARAFKAALGERSPKLIALTGYAQESDRQRAKECGFNEHMAKPVDMSKLAATLRDLLATEATRTPGASDLH